MESKHFCEGDHALIQCPNGTTIQVEHSFFGRKDNVTCPSNNGFLNTGAICQLYPLEVHDKCQGKPSCKIWASWYVLGDPCPGIHKYLNITYECSTENGNL